MVLGWDKDAVSRLGELRWDIFEGVEVETASIQGGLSGRRRLIYHWERGMASICLGRIGAAAAGDIDGYRSHRCGTTGRRTEGGGVHLVGLSATHIPPRPLLYQALSLARVFLLFGEHVIWLGLGKEGRTTRENELGKRRRRRV